MKLNKTIFIIFLGIFTFSHGFGQEEKYIGLFIYNFTKYFDWPEESKTGDFIIDVVGHKTVYEKLKELTESKKVGNQNIVVRNFNDAKSLDNTCQILFVGYWNSRFLPDILEKVKGNHTLIVTEKEGLINEGSAINFVIRDNTIKFEFSTGNTTKYGLKVDPRIRQLAVTVYD
jgi:hypothetical protein